MKKIAALSLVILFALCTFAFAQDKTETPKVGQGIENIKDHLQTQIQNEIPGQDQDQVQDEGQDQGEDTDKAKDEEDQNAKMREKLEKLPVEKQAEVQAAMEELAARKKEIENMKSVGVDTQELEDEVEKRNTQIMDQVQKALEQMDSMTNDLEEKVEKPSEEASPEQ